VAQTDGTRTWPRIWSDLLGRAEIGARCQTSTVIVTLSHLDTKPPRDDLWPVHG
jgi:hypothetical protein